MTKKKRRDPQTFVNDCLTDFGKRSWIKKLPEDDRKYIEAIIEAMHDNPRASVLAVAGGLKRELQLDLHINSIVRTLKEMLNDVKT